MLSRAVGESDHQLGGTRREGEAVIYSGSLSGSQPHGGRRARHRGAESERVHYRLPEGLEAYDGLRALRRRLT